MHSRVRAGLLAGAALVAFAPSGAAAYASPAASRPAVDRPLTWRVVPSRGRPGSALLGVTCVSATSCTAVGRGGSKTLVESWNGTAWSIVPSPNRHGIGQLSGISCVSASACTAVGTSAPSPSSPQSQYRTLVESWNGTAWSIVPSPNPQASQGYDIFSSVSCVTPAFCAAVGGRGQVSASEPLTEIWNGHAWSAVPGPSKLDDATLESVFCVSVTACTAVGFQYQETVIESWNGRAWSLVPSPDRASDPYLAGVSCTSASACTAVGAYFSDAAPAEQTLAESGTGSAWSIVPSPNAGSASADNLLAGLSCASARACAAVGSVGGSITSSVTLIEAWNGTRWSIVPSPVTRNVATLLYSVSCPSATMCMATGVRYLSSSQDSGRTLTELGTSSG
jgi:hypothetical protein